jgi:hypothetical protein
MNLCGLAFHIIYDVFYKQGCGIKDKTFIQENTIALISMLILGCVNSGASFQTNAV